MIIELFRKRVRNLIKQGYSLYRIAHDLEISVQNLIYKYERASSINADFWNKFNEKYSADRDK